MYPMLKAIAAAVILFYSSGQPYDIFSNTTHVPVNINLNGKIYHAQSTEAVFQGLKGLGNRARNHKAIEIIEDSVTPLSRLRDKAEHSGFNSLGKQEIFNAPFPNSRIADYTVKEEVMYQILLVKATQHLGICKALLETRKREIIENTFINKKYNDEFWGNGHSKRGRNALGKAWMRVRATFNHELAAGGIRKRVGISDHLAKVLGHMQHTPGSQFDGTIYTANDLARIKSSITVKDLKKNESARNKNFKNVKLVDIKTPDLQISVFQSVKQKGMQKPKSAKHAPGSAFNRVKRATGADYIAIINDINIPNQKVLKLTFRTISDAKRFSIRNGNAWTSGKDVFIGPKRAFLLFQKLNIASHGRTNPHPMWDALLWEARH